MTDDIENLEDEDLQDMVAEGSVWACCHNCHLPVSSIYEPNCFYCKKDIVIESLIIFFLDPKESN